MDYTFIVILVVIIALAIIIPISINALKKKRVKGNIKTLASGVSEMSPEEFLRMRNTSIGKKHVSTGHDFVGVYIIHNVTKDLYYVGQAKKVLDRVNAHFTGHGNGDVYADYKFGDQFTIKAINLQGSGYSSLDLLERNTITAYNAYNKGYNKTRGNSR